MQLTIPLFTAFALAAALPQDGQTTDGNMVLRTSDFQAFASDADGGYSNWIAFVTSDDANSMMATCSTASNEQLYSDTAWYSCKVYASDSSINLAFQVSPGFKQMRLKKSWDSGGMYMSGIAIQDTYWNDTANGNATAMGDGTYYVRAEPWAFDISSISGM